MLNWKSRTCAILLVCHGVHVQAAVKYVKSNAGGANNGSSWTNAYTSLVTALTNCTSSDEIWVANTATYYPAACAQGVACGANGANRGSSFVIPASCEVYGGFQGTETVRSQRNPNTYQTILSGDLCIDDNATNEPEWDCTQGQLDDNSYHVVNFTDVNIGNDTILDGFVIQRGHASGSVFANKQGGGINIEGGSPLIRDCLVRWNWAQTGGGIAANPKTVSTVVYTPDPVIQSTGASGSLQMTITQNMAGTGGSGVYCTGTASNYGTVTFAGTDLVPPAEYPYVLIEDNWACGDRCGGAFSLASGAIYLSYGCAQIQALETKGNCGLAAGAGYYGGNFNFGSSGNLRYYELDNNQQADTVGNDPAGKCLAGSPTESNASLYNGGCDACSFCP